MTEQNDATGVIWHKSSYSNGDGGNCVEVAVPDGGRLWVRDSKRPAGPVVGVGAEAWGAFVDGLRG
jgi:hypothetical protein